MPKKDWMARGHLQKRDQAQRTLSYIENPENRSRLGFDANTTMGKIFDSEAIPKFKRLDRATADWLDKSTRNHVIVHRLKNADREFVPVYRMIYRFLKTNPDVTDDDLIMMGLNARSEGNNGTPSHVAGDPPYVEIDTSTNGRMIIYFYAMGKKRNSARPAGQRGGEVRWGILKKAPVDCDELPHSESVTSSKLIIKTSGYDKGGFFYCAVRWENTRGEKGPWSRIVMAVVV
jgi:hypothetical protein